MKFNIKKFSIPGLVGIFFVSAIMCCCFTDNVQAQEPAPSCHQAEHETDSSQATEDCGCEQSLAIVKKDIALKNAVIALTTFIFKQQPKGQFFNSSSLAAYQAPPHFYDTTPLYIKHAVLRI